MFALTLGLSTLRRIYCDGWNTRLAGAARPLKSYQRRELSPFRVADFQLFNPDPRARFAGATLSQAN